MVQLHNAVTADRIVGHGMDIERFDGSPFEALLFRLQWTLSDRYEQTVGCRAVDRAGDPP